MIAGAALARWLSEPAQQAATQKAVEDFTLRWRDNSAVKSLREELDALPNKSAAVLIAAAKRFLDHDKEIEELIAELVAASAADPFFRAPFRLLTNDIHNGLMLFDQPELSISLGLIDLDGLAAKKSGPRGTTVITFTGQWTVLKLVKAGGAIFSFWEALSVGDDFVEENSGSCRLVGRRAIADGETLVVDGRSQSFVIEHAQGDIVCLQALIGVETAPLAVSYDSKAFHFASASSTDEQACRSQMMVTLLRLMDRTDALPAIKEALKTPHFHTRWQIMREFLAMDAEAAWPSLKEMAEQDPHPEIRAAARETLERFFGDEELVDEGEAVKCRA